MRPKCFGTVWARTQILINQSAHQLVNVAKGNNVLSDRTFAPHVATGSLKTLTPLYHMLLQEVSKH